MNKKLNVTLAMLPFSVCLPLFAQDAPVATSAPAATPAPAAKEEDLTSLNLDDLMNVQVTTASKKAQSLNSVPAAISVVTADDIRRSGVTNIPEALRLIPGVQVAQINSQKYSVGVRGFTGLYANKLLVLIDGRSIYNDLYGGVYWQDQQVVLEDIDRIELIQGPGGSLWGANAVNGIINIITKSAKDTQGGLVSTYVGDTLDKDRVAVRQGGKFGKDGFYRVFGLETDRKSSTSPGGTSNDDAWGGQRGGFRIDSGSDETGKLMVEAEAYHFNYHDKETLPITTAPYTHTDTNSAHSNGQYLMASWAKTLKDTSSIEVQGYYDHQQDPVARKDFAPQQRKADTVSLDFQDQLATKGQHSVIVGLNYRQVKSDVSNDFVPAKETNTVYGGFLQDDINLKKDVKLTVGTKIDHNNYTGMEYQPSARIAFTPDDKRTLWASVARAVRTPTRLDRALDYTQAIFPDATSGLLTVIKVVGSPDTKSEVLTAYEMGYRLEASKRAQFDLATFYNNYDNLSVTKQLTPSVVNGQIIVPVQFQSVGKAHLYGGELACRINPTDNWRLKLGASYIDGNSNSGPKTQYNIQSYTTLSKVFEFDSSVFFVAPDKNLNVPRYTKLDVRLGWHASKDLEVSVGGTNLLGGEYSQILGQAAANAAVVERGYYGKVTWKL